MITYVCDVCVHAHAHVRVQGSALTLPWSPALRKVPTALRRRGAIQPAICWPCRQCPFQGLVIGSEAKS